MSQQPPTTPDAASRQPGADDSVDAESLLSLLGDEYTQAILAAMGEDSVAAREIAERTDISRPTVYRRLNRLEATGAVTSMMTLDGDGHHRQAFRITLDELAVPLLDPSAAEPKFDENTSESPSASTPHASALHDPT